MPWAIVSLAAAVGLALSSTPASQAESPSRHQEVEACLRTCDAQDDATDRSTCRLQCEETVHAKDEPNIIRWRRTERIGGSFDGKEPTRTETTTVTTTTPRGPTTTTTTTRGTTPEPAPPPAPAARPSSTRSRYEALAGCQTRCDVVGSDSARATCKLRCLQTPHGNHAPVPPTSPSRAMTRDRGPSTTTPVAIPGERSHADKSSTDGRACRQACTATLETCVDDCSRSADRSTCELQCDQTASRCLDRCS